MRIIFMGTSDFGLPTLEKILSNNKHNLVAIYTKEPSIGGRGNRIQYSAIHNFAIQNNINIHTPKTLKDNYTQEQFKNFKPDLAVVVSYGLILPKEILDIPKYGCLNVHPSDLPLYRGSAPLQRSIMNNEKNSAVCIIKMDSGIDSGDVVNRKKFIINDDDNFLTISRKTSEIGAELIIKTIHETEHNILQFESQDHQKSTYANKIEKNESLIDWNKSCREIFNKVRALRGNLDAYLIYNNEKIKILECQSVKTTSNSNYKGIIIDYEFSIGCLDGIIKPTIVQKSGKKPMSLKDFLNGFKFKLGDKVC
ncbi:MAG: methionyl-tRNA formyltransferase [Alphaproteobacteria bacterium]|nr:methionyl-tRNA formyltransferase [Alphaproteobacteria bacterium]